MSWFDTSGLASIAKSALKEAQKTIDKALDITDSELTSSTPTNTPVDTNDDFFGTWGLTQSGSVKDQNKANESQDIITKSPTKSSKLTNSIWGSFTGSFFENTKGTRNDSVDSLDDSYDLGTQQFKQSKLVVQHSDESAIVDETVPTKVENVQIKDRKDIEQKKSDKNNRLSVVSTGSGKNSSESVEILTSSTGCTTTPESDIASLGLSVSASSSTQGLKLSESVEVLPESLASPSSLEILGTDSANCNQHSQHTDEFISPLESPLIEGNFSPASEKSSPESIDVIPDDQEETSNAEDTSYASISETTASTVLESVYPHLKPQKHFPPRHETPPDGAAVADASPIIPDVSTTFLEPITRAPSRTGMILALNPHLIDTQPLATAQDLTCLIKNPNIIDIPLDTNDSAISETAVENDEGSQSDRTMIASDNVMESSSDTSTTTESNSSYLKTMLADAMTEKSTEKSNESENFSMIDSKSNLESLEHISITPPRETSPLSSESRSDLVKIGSDHTSGHTSGDEVETATSSDIEIISSPNGGDSSSTQSRQSPAKQPAMRGKHGEANVDVLLGKMTFKRIKGHNRELSEASSVSDDCEVDRLIRRVSEMTEILELREAKLIEVSRRNAELQELNGDLRRQLDGVLTKQLESVDLSQVAEEYTQRLSALEKKFQQAIRDKDVLRKQLDQSKQEAAMRVSKGELESLVTEKDEIIKQLREEGEKLSKQQLQHSTIIKKLRAKEKEQESTIKNLKENVEDLSSETERLKKSLTAKDELERTQIEAIHQLTARNKKLENEVMQLQSQVDDVNQKFDTMKKSFEAAKKELADKNRASSELQASEQKLQSLENEKRMTESQNEAMLNQMDDLRLKLRESNQEFLKKEQILKTENCELLRRLEDAERRNEELAQSVLEVSKPLVRQLEALQSTHNMKMASFEKIEEGLIQKINELQGRLNTALENEKLSREECTGLRRRMSTLENQFAAATHEVEMLKMQVEQDKTEKMIAEQDFRREIMTLEEKLQEEKERTETLTKELNTLQQELTTERASSEVGNKSNSMQEHLREKSEPPPGSTKQSPSNTRNTSPTLSLGRTSLSESLGSAFWSPDDQFDPGPAPRYTNMFEMQMLQTNLKQREGELQQLQWELNRREHERTLLNSEISSLMTRVEQLEAKLVDHEKIAAQSVELQRQYDTLCQLYGEKVEENEELKLDLQDVKEMYKTQIDELLRQQKQKN